MYTSILVPLDGSSFGESALPVALALARRSGARVELVHAHEPNIYPSGAPMYDPRLDNEFKLEMRKELEAVAKRVRSGTGLSVTAHLLDGPINQTLGDYAAASGADLIVMTTHGYGGISRAWLGSVADYLVRHADTPVLLVRPGPDGVGVGAEPLFRRIVVSLDGSETAEFALDQAVTLGTPDETEYTLLHVVVPTVIVGYPSVYQYPRNRRPIDRAGVARREQAARVYLDRLCRELRANGYTATSEVIVHWQIARGILEYARSKSSDLIALTTRGRGGIMRAVLGSVGDKLVRGAKTPLLIYHPAEGDDAARPASLEEAVPSLTARPATTARA